jgi:hypothetical protein
MNFADKKNILIVGGVAAVIVVVLLVFVMKGKKGSAGAGAGGGAATGARRARRGAQTASAPAPGQVGAGAGAPAAGAAPTPGAVTPGAAALAGEQVAAGANLFGQVGKGTGQMSALTRSDPLINLEPPPPVITPEERTPLPPVITVAGGLRPAGETTGIMETIANRRVAGVKFNGGAWAILVRENESFVVKPGDVIEGTRITAISRDSVYVTDPDDQQWQVPLRGSGPGGGATPVTTRRISGLPGEPAEGF